MAFSFFGKKENGPAEGVFTDKAYMSTPAKMNACLERARKEPNTLFICWFPDTIRQFREFYRQQGVDDSCIMEATHINKAVIRNKTPVFAEHYPLHSKELELVKNWQLKEITVYSALDEPLFKHFGSERMIPLMKMLGMKEEEAIEHPMVSKSILKGQEEIARKVDFEISCHSQAEWMEKNLK
jgi:hypothetical protein